MEPRQQREGTFEDLVPGHCLLGGMADHEEELIESSTNLLLPSLVDVERCFERGCISVAACDVTDGGEFFPLVGPTTHGNGDLVGLSVELRYLVEERADKLHRLFVALDKVRGGSAGDCHGDLGCAVGALKEEVVNGVSGSRLERDASDG
jgi:hypothetical protein